MQPMQGLTLTLEAALVGPGWEGFDITRGVETFEHSGAIRLDRWLADIIARNRNTDFAGYCAIDGDTAMLTVKRWTVKPGRTQRSERTSWTVMLDSLGPLVAPYLHREVE